MGSGMLRVACNGFKKAGHEGSKLDSFCGQKHCLVL